MSSANPDGSGNASPPSHQKEKTGLARLGSIFSTLPGLLTAIAALITAIATAFYGGTQVSAQPMPTPTVTVTQLAPAPTITVTRTIAPPRGDPAASSGGIQTPTTASVSASPPSASTVLDTFKGTGNQVTPSFNVPDGGDYIVVWSYSGNTDPTMGRPTNFIISETGSGTALGLPNEIATLGQGSTEITGAGSTDRLNVQSVGSWTITIKSAS